MTNLLQQAINCDDADRAARAFEGRRRGELPLPDNLAGRSRAARPLHWRMAEDRGALSGLVTEPRRFRRPGPQERSELHARDHNGLGAA